MSQPNEALLRAGYDALNSGDLDGWIATYHADAEPHELASVPDTAIYRGHSGPRKWIESILDVSEEFGFEAEEFTGAGKFTLVRVLAYARGRAGGVPARLEGNVYRGQDEVAKAFEDVWDTWDRFEFQEPEVRDLGDSAVWLGRVQMQGKASEVALDQEFTCLFRMRGALVARVDAFLTWAEALEAAGLQE